jgi:hypothetical protein
MSDISFPCSESALCCNEVRTVIRNGFRIAAQCHGRVRMTQRALSDQHRSAGVLQIGCEYTSESMARPWNCSRMLQNSSAMETSRTRRALSAVRHEVFSPDGTANMDYAVNGVHISHLTPRNSARVQSDKCQRHRNSGLWFAPKSGHNRFHHFDGVMLSVARLFRSYEYLAIGIRFTRTCPALV